MPGRDGCAGARWEVNRPRPRLGSRSENNGGEGRTGGEKDNIFVGWAMVAGERCCIMLRVVPRVDKMGVMLALSS